MTFEAMKPGRKTGEERFQLGTSKRDEDLLSFWRWSVSDLMSNATRGRLAEYIVAMALDVACEVRAEWDAYDLETPDGIKVEVKSSAYVQTWAQETHSRISFGCQSTRIPGGLAENDAEFRRRADVYVFALLHERDRGAVDPLNLAQWEFYVVASRTLNEKFPTQKSISLPVLRRLADAVSFEGLNDRVRTCVPEVLS